MQINEHILKLSGKASIVGPLVIGKDYTFSGTGSVVKVEENDNQDGTINVTYILKPIIATVGDMVINNEDKVEDDLFDTY